MKVETESLNLSHSADEDEIKQLLKPEGGDDQGGQGGQGGQGQDGQDDHDDADDKAGKGAAGGPGDEGDEDDDDQRAVKSKEELEAGTDAEKQEVRERKRQDRLNQRQRQRQRIETLERQLSSTLSSNQDMQQRLAQLEGANMSTQYTQLERAEQELMGRESQLKDILADATVKGDGVRSAEATTALINLQRQKELVTDAKTAMQQQARQPKQTSLSREAVEQARSFMAEVPWYKGPKATDTDSRVMSTLDNALTAEGWDPATPSYWEELRKRARDYLPHKFSQGGGQGGGTKGKNTQGEGAGSGNQGYNSTDRGPKNVVAGGGSNSTGGERSTVKYQLSADRVKAMKEAGIWDDPKRRASMIKRYQEHDRQTS